MADNRPLANKIRINKESLRKAVGKEKKTQLQQLQSSSPDGQSSSLPLTQTYRSKKGGQKESPKKTASH